MNRTLFFSLPFAKNLIVRLLRSLAFVTCAFVVAACGSGGGGGGGSGGGGVSIVAPIIVAQPASQTVRDGQGVSFTVTATGTAPLIYQWQRGGVAIAGATSATYTIPVAQLSDNGAVFSVVVSNAAGSLTSTPAILTVSAVSPSVASNTPTTVSVIEGQTASFVVVASGSSPLTFQWRRAGTPIAGANSTSYTTPPTTAADNGAMFDVVVANVAGSIVSPMFTLSVTAAAVAPAIATQPRAQSIPVGDPVTFTVVATGTAPLTYQWLRDASPITGAQASSYSITSTTLSDNGAQFSVRVANASGSVTSASALLTVTARPGIALLAGNIGGPGNRDGVGQIASFNSPAGAAIDSAGNVYVGDYGNHLVRKITPAGVVTTLAGSPGVSGSADGIGSAARFSFLHQIAVDAAGIVYVADTGNSTIRKVTSSGAVTTLAGSPGSPGSTDGIGAAAQFSLPTGVAIDGAGNVYVADSGNHTIRKITPAGVVTTLAGSAGMAGFANGAGAAALFSSPSGVITDGAGNVYVSDTGNHLIRKVTSGGVVTTLAGAPGVRGSADGTGNAANFNVPIAVSTDAGGNLYVADSVNNTVRKIAPGGVVTTLAGAAGIAGSIDGTGGAARFSTPIAIAADASGNVFVGEADNHTIRKIDTSTVVTTFAGAPAISGIADGTGSAAQFNTPRAVATDGAGNVYVSDTGNDTIRKVSAGGITTTLAGSPGLAGSVDGTGSAARFTKPEGLVIDSAGNVIVADFGNNTIRRITPAGVVTTLAGTAGVRGAANGTGAAASFNSPVGVALDAAGNIYVADSGNQLIRKVTPAGVVTTYAGVAGTAGSADGPAASATFRGPSGVAVDTAGNVYVGDSNNATIRKIDTSAVVSTAAGRAGITGSTDGSAALFNNPNGVVADATGNLYVADSANGTIRKITPAGVVTTVAGVADGRSGVQTGALPGRLVFPFLIAIDSAGNLYCTSISGVLRITLS